MGPQVNENAVLDFTKAIEKAEAAGGEILFGGSPIDGKGNYEPLQDKTIERKREAGMPFPEYPLIGTGQMTGALLTGGDGPYIKKRATPKDLEVEITAPNVKAPYGQYHQVGHSRGYFPARPWFGVSKEANKGIYKSLGMAIGRMTRAK